MHWTRFKLALVMSAGLLFATTGCVGPIWSTVDLRAAESALEQAEEANASELAPYEYQRALELLKKAREEWGYSEFGTSRRYAEMAREYAEQAREKASTEPWTGPPEAAIQGSE